ncbi:hypothetical protein C8T65DRAFT_664814 [Cerioporus squamosus]|nr:hypothetical protein C8T65DRAFT_664814 [Cerioporus squamosus]
MDVMPATNGVGSRLHGADPVDARVPGLAHPHPPQSRILDQHPRPRQGNSVHRSSKEVPRRLSCL